jgi:hypothetical protein
VRRHTRNLKPFTQVLRTSETPADSSITYSSLPAYRYSFMQYHCAKHFYSRLNYRQWYFSYNLISVAVIFDRAGNLYGTTAWGGVQGGTCLYPGCGVVFQLTPTSTGPWTESLLYTFLGGPNVGFPGGLAFGPDGDLYGPAAGAVGVFELSPPPDENDRRDRQ